MLESGAAILAISIWYMKSATESETWQIRMQQLLSGTDNNQQQ